MKIYCISEKEVARALSPQVSLRLAEATFKLIAQNKVSMPPKMYLNLPSGGDFRAMPAFLDAGKSGACGIKWISVFPQNAAIRIPTVNGTILLSSPRTGLIDAVLEANTITAMRTAAAAALASKHMANPHPRTLAIIGAGLQAQHQLKAHLALYSGLKRVKVWGFVPGEAQAFCKKYGRLTNLHPANSIQEASFAADIIITCTSSRKPLLMDKWVGEGAHINAIGADAKGKQELDPKLLLRARIVVDEWFQASHSGEINVPISKKLLSHKHIAGELAEVVAKRLRGRISTREVTVFDSTGLAALDIYFAQYVRSYYARRSL